MKKTIIIVGIAAVLLLAILFVPIYQGTYDDGGTCVYNALTYKLVVWNKLYAYIDNNGDFVSGIYQKTSVFRIPDNNKSIDELWKIEIGNRQ